MTRAPRALAALLFCAAPFAHAQTLADRVARLPDGEVRMSFRSRPGVCGDGRSFVGDAASPDGMRVFFYGNEGGFTGTSPDFREGCLPGPVRISFLKTADGVTDVRLYVGGGWRGTGQDLGTVPAGDAAMYLLDLSRTASERSVGTAILAAALADSVQLSPRLITMGRDRSLRPLVRERALRWLPEVAEREGAGDPADRAMRAIAEDESDLASVRDRAVRSLAQSEATDAFLRALYTKLDLTSLKERLIRRLGETASPENVAWLRLRVEDGAEVLALRDRAIRVLGEEHGERELLQQLYPRVADTQLRDRIIRVVGDRGDDASRHWLRAIVLDEAESTGLRDRAVRSLAEAGYATADLIRVYDGVTARPIRERLIRIFADRSDRSAVDKLVAIAKSDPDESLRRLAVKRLGETGDPRAREFLETTVRR
jgi:HEAT repeat protein